MICKHLFADARNGHDIPWTRLAWQGRFDPPKDFGRDDGTQGTYAFSVRCGACSKSPADQVQYIEEFYRAGQLHVADFCR